MKTILSLLLLISMLAMACHSHGHFLWAIAGSDTVRLEVADRPGKGLAPILGKRIGDLKPIHLGRLAESDDKLRLSAPIVRGWNVAGANLVYGVHGDFLVDWSAKAIVEITGAGESLGLPAEILLKHGGGGLEALVLKGGKPAPGAEVELWAPGSSSPVKLKTGKDGSVELGLDHGSIQDGLLAVSAIVIEPGAGKHKGAAYKEKRYFTTVTLRVER